MPANPSVMLARMVAQVARCIHFEVGRDKTVLFWLLYNIHRHRDFRPGSAHKKHAQDFREALNLTIV